MKCLMLELDPHGICRLPLVSPPIKRNHEPPEAAILRTTVFLVAAKNRAIGSCHPLCYQNRGDLIEVLYRGQI